MVPGRIFRESDGWCAFCEMLGVFTQGPTRKEAVSNLAEAIELQLNRPRLKITIAEFDGEKVLVLANYPALLAADMLRYQRIRHRLTLAEVAKKLGSPNVNAYAVYERGERDPSISKFTELLAAVAPELAFVVEERSLPKAVAKARKTKISKSKR